MPRPWSAEDDKTLLKAVQEYQDRGKKLNWVAIHEDHLSHMDFKNRQPNHVLRQHYLEVVDPRINSLEFTDEERETIRVERLEKQPPTGWSEISEMLSNETSTRPPGMIKNK